VDAFSHSGLETNPSSITEV